MSIVLYCTHSPLMLLSLPRLRSRHNGEEEEEETRKDKLPQTSKLAIHSRNRNHLRILHALASRVFPLRTNLLATRINANFSIRLTLMARVSVIANWEEEKEEVREEGDEISSNQSSSSSSGAKCEKLNLYIGMSRSLYLFARLQVSVNSSSFSSFIHSFTHSFSWKSLELPLEVCRKVLVEEANKPQVE